MNKNPFLPRIISKAGLLALALLTAPPALVHAADFNWDSTSDGNWSALANWGVVTWIPGNDFPDNIDTVTLGQGGWLPFSGEEAQTRTITIGAGEAYTLASLTFSDGASNSPQNYYIGGTGKLIFDSGGSAPATLSIGQISRRQTPPPILSGPNHEIAVDIEIHGALEITAPGQGNPRNPILSGSITGNGSDPVMLSIKGGGNVATLELSSTANDFNGGEVNLMNAAGLLINDQSLKGATLRFSGTDSVTNKRVVISASNSVAVNFTRMIVESNGTIETSGFATSSIVDWRSTEVAAGKTLEITRGNSVTWRLNGANQTLSLGAGALVTVNQTQVNRYLRASLENGALLEGNGTVTTRGSGAAYVHRFQIGDGGIADPGLGEGAIGTLTFGSAEHNGSNILFMEGSILRMQLNGLSAGAEHDQLIVAAGNFTLEETGSGVTLSLSVNYRYLPGDTLTLLNVAGTGAEPGASFTGAFAGLEEGALVNMGLWGGNPATARISYLGGDGNDVILYNFSVIPEPGTWALLGLGGFAALLLRRRKARA